jgi:DNA primase
MARVDILIPEPTPQYTEENQRQVTQSLRTMQDKLNTSYQEELKQEVERMSWYSTRFGC